jgi:hypothetical protein
VICTSISLRPDEGGAAFIEKRPPDFGQFR